MATQTLKLPSSYAVAVSSSQDFVAAAGRNVVLASLLHRKRLYSVHPLSHPSSLSFSPDAAHLVVKNTLGEIVVLDVAEGAATARFTPPEREEGPRIYYSPTGCQLAHVTWSGRLRIHRTLDLAVEQEREFPNDMLFDLSVSATRELWLVAHRSGGSRNPAIANSTQLSLWRWPLVEPIATFDFGQDHLLTASLSPCGSYIAIARQFFGPPRYELVLFSAEHGREMAVTPIDIGGSGSRIGWADDSSAVCATVRGGFAVFSLPSLALEKSLRYQYPSDMAFINSNRALVVGTWELGTVAELIDA